MLVPSSKDRIYTYTTEKIQVIGFCDLFIVHPETRCPKKITFQVVNHEGSVIVSCATSLELGLIQLQSVFNDSVPDCGRLLYSDSITIQNLQYKYQNIKSSSSLSDQCIFNRGTIYHSARCYNNRS